MRWTIVTCWASAIVMGLVGCVGGPGGGFGGDGGASSSSGGSSSGSSGSSNEIRAADFDQNCQATTDCTQIYEGEACNPCACANAAIAMSALQSYESKIATVSRSCAPQAPVSCPRCAPTTASCTGNKCRVVIGVPPSDAGGGG